MTDTAAAQLRRVLHLIPELADDEEHAIDEVAARLGIDRRTLLRDLRSISERFDDPGGFVEGVSIYIDEDGVSVHADHFLRPMRLTLAELGALELGLAMLRSERPPEEQRAIDGARARLRQVITALPAEAVAEELRVASGEPVDAALLAEVRRALRERRKLRLRYQKPDAGEPDDRLVRPYAVAHANGAWYVVGHCERSGGVRVFRLDRIVEAQGADATFDMPADFELDGIVRDGRVFHAEGADRLVVRYSERIARWIAEREQRDVAADGSLTLEHPMADADWAVRHVLQYGPDAEILAPPAMRAAVRHRLERMRRPG